MAHWSRYPYSHTGERRDPPFRCERCAYLTSDGQPPVCVIGQGKRGSARKSTRSETQRSKERRRGKAMREPVHLPAAIVAEEPERLALGAGPGEKR